MIPEKWRKYFNPEPFYQTMVPVIFVNTIISMLISIPLLKAGNAASSPDLPGIITFAAHYFSLNLAAGLVVYCLSVLPFRKLIMLLSSFLFFCLQIVLFIDMKIFTIFHYHINALVLNLLTTEGVSDSVILGQSTILMFAGLLLTLFLLEIFIHLAARKIPGKLAQGKGSLLRNTAKIIFFTGLVLIALDKGMYAYADLVNDTAITRNAKLYPLYQPFTIKRFMKTVFHFELNREQSFKVQTSHKGINYPKAKLRFDTAGDKKYNIIILAVEGLRFDMLDKDVMPNVWAFGQENSIYENHYSGGNGSRFGIFSLLYGIHGSYWHNFLAMRISPVLIDTLKEKGYDFRILASTALTFPEFRKTAFVRISDSIEDTFTTNDMPERDKIITGKLTDYISSVRSGQSFFAFLFYNSSHQPYKYPGNFEKFHPVIKKEDINYFLDTTKEKGAMMRNRYKNALFYTDYLIGKILSSLKQHHLLENTVVVITGDHGEEFYENDYLGHTSSFDDYQIKNLFVAHFPGYGRRLIERLTSHQDLVPTLMESLGCISPINDYAQGLSLLGNQEHPYVTSANWDTAALIDEQYKVIFSTELYNANLFEVHNRKDYAMLGNPKDAMKQEKQHLLDNVLKMSEFYK
jgi:uncharacterized protein